MIRLPDSTPGKFPAGFNLQTPAYWREVPRDATGPDDSSCRWRLSLGNYVMGDLDAHEVEEHDDGTITVSPSILVTAPGRRPVHRHGFLKRGVWHPCGDDRP